MEHLQGEILSVVLKIKKGKGFSFISNPLVIVASLDGIKLESNQIAPCNSPKINVELIWESDKKYLRRLRKINTAFKIECFIESEQKREKLGYIFLNLKEAHIQSVKDTRSEIETWHTFLGVPRDIPACYPQILIVFKIRECPQNFLDQTTIFFENNLKNTLQINMDDNKKSNYIQIGPPKLCTKFFELDIDIAESGNLCSIITPNLFGTPLKIQFHIMGMTLVTKEFCAFKGIVHKEKFKVQIKSEIQFLAAYFQQFPSLTFYLVCGEKLIGSGSLILQDLTDLKEHFPASAKEKVTLKAADGKDSHIADCLTPFLKVEVTLMPVLLANHLIALPPNTNDIPASRLTSASIQQSSLPRITDQAAIIHEVIPEGLHSNLEEPMISCGLIPEIQIPDEAINSIQTNESISPKFHTNFISEKSHGISLVHNISETDLMVDEVKQQEQVIQNEELKSNVEKSVNGERNLQNQDNNPPSGSTSAAAYALPKVYVQELATKYIEELEDWKEKQQEMFKFELKRKTEKHLNKLSFEWSKRQQALEKELIDRIENCHSLKTRLEEVLLELEMRLENLNKTELELQLGKNELDKLYTMKFKELRRASKKHQHDMEEKIKQCNLEKVQLLNKIKIYEEKISKLNQQLKTEIQTRLSVEESEKMLAEKEVIEEKLGKAIELRNYFKEQYNLALEEIHKHFSERKDLKKWTYSSNYNKDGEEIVGLVEEINNEVDEMKKDQTTLKALREEILKYGKT